MFQQTVTTIAIVILIITLCVIGIMLYRAKYNTIYPPVIANCPDYWEASGNYCINSMNLGNSKCNVPMDFTKPQWSSSNSMCQKYKWAKSCNLTWDGITENADLCDD